MKKSVKALLLVMCAIVLVVATVFTTLAYMTSQTATITNTFSVGNVKITMDEAPVDVYGNVVEGDRRTANNYKLVPNASYTKDPTIHVQAGSEEAYVFVSVANGIAAIEAENEPATTIEAQMIANGWTKHSTEANLWYKVNAVDARTQAVEVPVFANFTVAADADVSSYTSANITLVGYAIQKEGFANAEAAWEAAGDEVKANLPA